MCCHECNPGRINVRHWRTELEPPRGCRCPTFLVNVVCDCCFNREHGPWCQFGSVHLTATDMRWIVWFLLFEPTELRILQGRMTLQSDWTHARWGSSISMFLLNGYRQPLETPSLMLPVAIRYPPVLPYPNGVNPPWATYLTEPRYIHTGSIVTLPTSLYECSTCHYLSSFSAVCFICRESLCIRCRYRCRTCKLVYFCSACAPEAAFYGIMPNHDCEARHWRYMMTQVRQRLRNRGNLWA